MDKVVNQIVTALEAQGFETKEHRSGRVSVYRAGVFVAQLPARFRPGTGLANALAPLRRAGFRWPAS